MLVIDIETTGVNPETCSILSIGALDLANPERRFYGECRIWDHAHVSTDSMKVNGFTTAEINDPHKKREGELVREFMEWSQHLDERTLAGQNPSFDRDFLQAAALREKLAWDFAHRTIDTHTLCYMHIVKSGNQPPIDPQRRRSALNLDTILNYCGIPDEPMPHNALTGALSHAEVIARLLYNQKLLPEFNTYQIPWQSN